MYQYLQGMTPFPLNLGLKALNPNRKDARFTFHTRHTVQSVTADLLVQLSSELSDTIQCAACRHVFSFIVMQLEFSQRNS